MKIRLCSLTDMPLRGGRLFEGVAGRDILVFKTQADHTLVGYDAACPHIGAQLRPENLFGDELICPLHQWRFNIHSGEATNVPNCRLQKVPLEIVGPDIWAKMDEPEKS